MTALSLQFMRSFPVLAAPTRGFRSGFRHLSLTEVRVLLVTLAISLCLFVWVPIRQHHRNLDERAMLSAMLAAGGMPLVYSPPALCAAPIKFSGFKRDEMRTMLQN
jgi:hypothetical protein